MRMNLEGVSFTSIQVHSNIFSTVLRRVLSSSCRKRQGHHPDIVGSH
ncbi:Protein of unknown function [Pyronema omphalodes CBS 100304]|uniref:Uncharacterized protein n=1 Tax=Pyronema omphalodes (strain CBS 100304) TaxID=1076935 RepID=U4LRE6_PYROM|nr:Protein of unknown function [Pyronema omphalodes CBS 100304]